VEINKVNESILQEINKVSFGIAIVA